jgi:hypothetical protein
MLEWFNYLPLGEAPASAPARLNAVGHVTATFYPSPTSQRGDVGCEVRSFRRFANMGVQAPLRAPGASMLSRSNRTYDP